jgi:hypothetical protein
MRSRTKRSTSQYEDFHRHETEWSGLLQRRQCEVRAQAPATRSCYIVRHARSKRHDRCLCARMREGRTRGRAQDRSAGPALAVLLGSRHRTTASCRSAKSARMLPPRRDARAPSRSTVLSLSGDCLGAAKARAKAQRQGWKRLHAALIALMRGEQRNGQSTSHIVSLGISSS